MGVLDLKAKVPVLPKDIDDKGLASLFKNLDKKSAEWPAVQKALQQQAMHMANAFQAILSRADAMASDKKTPPEQVATLKKLSEACKECAKHYNAML